MATRRQNTLQDDEQEMATGGHPLEVASAPDAPQQASPGHAAPAPADGDLVVVHEVVAWRVPVQGTTPPRVKVWRRFRGELIPGPGQDLPDTERQRLLEQGAIAPVGQAAQAIAAAGPGAPVAPGDLGDAQLAAMAESQLVAYVTQHPEDAERVARLELARAGGTQRANVLAAAGADPQSGEPLE